MANSRHRGRTVDYKIWNGTESVLDYVGSSGIILMGNIAGALGTPGTFLRIRGNVLVSMTPGAGTDRSLLGLGIMIADENQDASAEFPGPVTGQDQDWLWHQLIPFDAFGLTAYAGDAINLNHWIEIDSKAMRRARQGQRLVAVGEAVASSGTATLEAMLSARVLLGV